MTCSLKGNHPMYFGWRVVLGAFVSMMLATGFFTYAFSLLVNPIRAEFGVGLEQVMYSLTLGTLTGLFMSPIAGALVDRYSVRIIMSVGALLTGLGFYLTAQAASVLQFNLGIGASMAICNGLAGAMSGSAAVTRWFSANRGRALGFAAMGTSLGGVVYPALIAWWVDAWGWRIALQNMAAVTLILVLPTIWFNIRNYPPDVSLEPQPERQTASPASLNTTAAAPGFAQILREPGFWLLGMSMGMVFSAFSALVANLSPYASRLGVGEAGVSTMIALLAVSGLVGKIVFGMAADRIELKHGLWTAHGLLLFAFAILAFEPPYGLMLLAAVCIGLCTGGLLPVWNAMVAQMFGVASFGRAMGAMGPLITLNIMPGFAIVGRLFDSTGSYTAGLLVYGAVIIGAALLLLPLKPARAH